MGVWGPRLTGIASPRMAFNYRQESLFSLKQNGYGGSSGYGVCSVCSGLTNCVAWIGT